MSAIIEATNVGFDIGGRTLLDAVTLALRPGRMTVVIGPNGAGKSTLLRLLAGEIAASRGAISCEGEPIGRLPGWRLAQARAVMTQASNLAFPFRVREIVRIGLDSVGRRLAAEQRSAIIRDSLETADIAPLSERHYQTLSGGEKQRVQFARALAQLTAGSAQTSRQALLLDEPVASLDLAHQYAVMDAARRVAGGGAAVLAVLHDLNLAASYGDELLLLRRGRVAALGPPAAVLTEDLLSGVFAVDLEVRGGEGGTMIRRRAPPPSGSIAAGG